MPDGAWSRILRVLAEALGRPEDELRVGSARCLAARREVRLRFNAPTHVDCRTFSLTLVDVAGASVFGGEAELFHWLSDDEWELVELADGSGLA